MITPRSLALALLLAGLAASGPAYPESNPDDPCATLGSAMAGPCRASRELLMRDAGEPRADLRILVTASTEGWIYGPNPPRSRTTESCAHPGPLILPAGWRIAVSVTSRDGVYDWSVPALGVKTAAIPGRINLFDVGRQQEGTIAGHLSAGSGRAVPARMSGDIRFLAPKTFVSWVAEGGLERCEP